MAELQSKSLSFSIIRICFGICLALYIFSAMRLGAFHIAHVIIIILFFVKVFSVAHIAGPSFYLLLVVVLKFITDALRFPLQELNFHLYAFLVFSVFVGDVLLRAREEGVVTLQHVRWYIRINVLHAIFVIIQFGLFNLANDFSTLNPYGSLSPMGPDPYSAGLPAPYNPFAVSRTIEFFRPNGLNWEPSAAAFWGAFAITVLLTNFNSFRHRWLCLLILTLGVLATQSLIGLLHLAVIFSYQLIKLIRHPIARSSSLVIVAALIGYAIADFSGSLPGRFAEILIPGTSGYVRVTAPFSYLWENGLGFIGNAQLGSDSYSDWYGFSLYTSRPQYATIDNGYLQIVFEFGWIGLMTMSLLLALQCWRFGWSHKSGLAIVSVLFSFNYGGHLFNGIFLVAMLMCYNLANVSSEDYNPQKTV